MSNDSQPVEVPPENRFLALYRENNGWHTGAVTSLTTHAQAIANAKTMLVWSTGRESRVVEVLHHYELEPVEKELGT